MVRFDYQLTQEEYANAAKLYQMTRRGYPPALQKFITWGGWTLFAIFVVALGFKLYAGPALSISVLQVAAFPVILVSVRVYAAWKNQQRYQASPSLRAPHTIEADDAGLRMITPSSDGRIRWDIILRWAENDQVMILVQQGGQVYYPISKRNVPPATIDSFRYLLEARVSRINPPPPLPR